MHVHLEHIGPLDRADLEIGDLTVICGENNTGKTYATYAFYGFLRSWRQILALDLHERLAPLLTAGGPGKIDLVAMFEGKVNQTLARLSEQFTSGLPRVFAARPELFEKAVFRIQVAEGDLADALLATPYERTLRDAPDERTMATITKRPGQPQLEVVVGNQARPESALSFSYFVTDAIADIVFAPLLPSTYIASAERTGAAIFLKELDFARTRLLDALGSEAKDYRSPWRLLQRLEVDYPWPVQDNVDFVRQLDELEKGTSPLVASNPELLTRFEDIIGGAYRVVKGKGVHFEPRGSARSRLTMKESSSSVRALVDIGFFLKAQAEAGDLLMIDEPELNLHPANQRRLARLLVALVNAGLRVFITTHSDYLVKEFNTLIMLHSRSPGALQAQQQYGYEEGELLDPRRVRLYTTGICPAPSTGRGRRAKVRTLCPAKIDPSEGIEVETFDTTIDEMNDIQSMILFGGEA